MKNKLTIIVDSDKEESIQIGKDTTEAPKTDDGKRQMILTDIACCCEAICTMILIAHNLGLKDKDQELHTCIEHLRTGVNDNFETKYVGDLEQRMSRRHNL